MGRASGTVTVKTENSLDISWIPYFFDLRMKQWEQRKCRNLNFKLFCLSLTIQQLLTTFWNGFLMSKSEENKVILTVKNAFLWKGLVELLL